jgi:hypothetical protein
MSEQKLLTVEIQNMRTGKIIPENKYSLPEPGTVTSWDFGFPADFFDDGGRHKEIRVRIEWPEKG